VLRASGVGAELELGRLPTSRTLAEHFADDDTRWRLQLSGGDDYELCFTAAPADAFAIEQAMAACELGATVVGRVTAQPGLRLLQPDGATFAVEAGGYDHFPAGHA
jgi:thiamine-monophosphate kinase